MSELVEPVVTLELHQISSRCRSSISDAERGQLVGSRAAMDESPGGLAGALGGGAERGARAGGFEVRVDHRNGPRQR